MLIKRLYVVKCILFYLNPNEAENIRDIRGVQILVGVNNYFRVPVHRNQKSR